MSTDPREFEHPIDGPTPNELPTVLGVGSLTPEAIEAGVASGMDTHDWELLKSQGDIGEAVELAIRDALSVAAPFTAAQAKAEALREAADAVEAIDPAWDSALYVDDAYHPLPDWLRARAATIETEAANV